MDQDGWIKHFTDGTTETGYDKDIALGLSSWSKGRHDCLKKVEAKLGGLSCSINSHVETRFLQSDTIETSFSSGINKVVQRSISCVVSPDMKKYLAWLAADRIQILLFSNNTDLFEWPLNLHPNHVPEKWIGKRIEIVLDADINRPRWGIR